MPDARTVSRTLALSQFTILAVALVLAALMGCSKDEEVPLAPGGPPTTSSFVGAYVSGGDGGKITVTVNSLTLAPKLRAASLHAAVVTATGTLNASGGGAIALSGAYNTETDTLNLQGSLYTFAGQYDSSGVPPAIVGGYTGPNGSGLFGCFSGGSGVIKPYCGSYINATETVGGRWNFIAVADTAFTGAAFAQGSSDGIIFEGRITGTGTTRNMTLEGGNPPDLVLTGDGTLDTSTGIASGTWTLQDNVTPSTDNGTWDASLCP